MDYLKKKFSDAKLERTKEYRENYDKIFGKKRTRKKIQQKKIVDHREMCF